MSREGGLRRRTSLVALAVAAAVVAACDTAPPRPTFADFRFTGETPLNLDVAAIDVRVAYQPPFHPPNVEHLFPVPPARAAEAWAHDRLRAVGHEGRARFTITDASVIETELPHKTGIAGALDKEPAQRYQIALAATLALLDEHGLPRRTADAHAEAVQDVLDGATPNEREQVWYDMTGRLMAVFDRQMTAEIRTAFGPDLE
jgi:hypothetical protein